MTGRCRLLRQAILPVLIAAVVASTGCASLMAKAGERLSGSLAAAVADQNDVETVRQGAPAYLLLIDGLIQDSPDNAGLLLTGARLYSSYAAAFADDPERAKRLAEKGRDYGWRGLCRSERAACGSWERPYEEFALRVEGLGESAVPALFTAASAWATWIQANREDWVAVADKARVELMMERVVALDEHYQRGAAHLYLGVLATLIPKALGGRPEVGRQHLERAVELSEGRDLTAKLLLAREYARAVFDRDLHDRLCREILSAEPVEPGLTLTNTLAQAEARRLLASADEYFGE